MNYKILISLYKWIEKNLKNLDPHSVMEFHEILKSAKITK